MGVAKDACSIKCVTTRAVTLNFKHPGGQITEYIIRLDSTNDQHKEKAYKTAHPGYITRGKDNPNVNDTDTEESYIESFVISDLIPGDMYDLSIESVSNDVRGELTEFNDLPIKLGMCCCISSSLSSNIVYIMLTIQQYMNVVSCNHSCDCYLILITYIRLINIQQALCNIFIMKSKFFQYDKCVMCLQCYHYFPMFSKLP